MRRIRGCVLPTDTDPNVDHQSETVDQLHRDAPTDRMELHTHHGQFRLKFEQMCVMDKTTNIQHIAVTADAPEEIESSEADQDRRCIDWTGFLGLLTITAHHEELESMPPLDRKLLWSAISETQLVRIRIVVKDLSGQAPVLVVGEMSEYLRRCRRPLYLVVRIIDRRSYPVMLSCRLPTEWVSSPPLNLRVLVTGRANRQGTPAGDGPASSFTAG